MATQLVGQAAGCKMEHINNNHADNLQPDEERGGLDIQAPLLKARLTVSPGGALFSGSDFFRALM